MPENIGLCTVSTRGAETMCAYDKLPPHVRYLIAGAKYNICSTCFAMALEDGENSPEKILDEFYYAIATGDNSRILHLIYGL